MKLSVSNIAWSAAEDLSMPGRLLVAGVEGLEVAPGRIMPDFARATHGEARAIAERYDEIGLPITSMQALLFGRGDLQLLRDDADWQDMRDWLEHVIAIAGSLGCGPLVFGSPKNRLRNAMPIKQAQALAATRLAEIAAPAAAAQVTFCIEANAAGYGCDFICKIAEATTLVALIDNPQIRVVADTGNMIMQGEPPEAIVPALPFVAHVHVSAPGLGPIVPHRAYIFDILARLRDGGYDGIVTVEMRQQDDGDAQVALFEGIDMVRALLDRGAP